jgi:hypothetical protein
VDIGVIDALTRCFVDYHPSLLDKPPCSESWNERFFGLIRPDGSLKPHAKIISEFTATYSVVIPAKRVITLPYKSSEYYESTLEIFMTLYQQ